MFSNTINKLGISFSVICTIHCLLLPVLLILVPTVAAFAMYEEYFHTVLTLAIVPMCALSIAMACHKHANNSAVLVPLRLACIGALFLVAAALHTLLPSANELIERGATLVGGILIGLSHYTNYKLCREDTCHKSH